MVRSLSVLVSIAALSLLTACAGHWDPPMQPASAKAKALEIERAEQAAEKSAEGEYRIAAGDRVKISVAGEKDLSGEFTVDKAGLLIVPYMEPVKAKGVALKDFEADFARELMDADILKNPKVTAEVTSSRPVSISGEVKAPGQFPYVNGMTVRAAVALADGYTYLATEKSVEITRGGKKIDIDVTAETKVMPGDEIRVPSRFF